MREILEGSKRPPGLLLLAVAVAASSCGLQQSISHKVQRSAVDLKSITEPVLIGDAEKEFLVLSAATLRQMQTDGKVTKVPDHLPTETLSADAKAFLREVEPVAVDAEEPVEAEQPGEEPAEATQPEEQLLVGLPLSLMNQKQLFGAVITKVSDTENATLGMLKLTDLTPVHMQPILAKDENESVYVLLRGCVANCTEESELQDVALLPVAGFEEASSTVIVNLAPLGQALNLIKMLDPEGEALSLEPVASKATWADYSDDTLLFDVESVFAPKGNPAAENKPAFTVRWYLRSLAGITHENFVKREPREEVGYFVTERGATKLVSRFPVDADGEAKPIKYYLKDVPAAVLPHFVAAIDQWNDHFKSKLGRNLFSYESLAPSDPRYNDIVAGDIRYNVIEWDTKNKAPYGGLGPLVGNQLTGETISANVLVQGPSIERLYRTWFKVLDEVRDLEGDGLIAQAAKVRSEKLATLAKSQVERPDFKLRLTLGKLDFRITGQMPELQDDQRMDFEDIPEGMTYDTYMPGYWMELLAHELGHNIGLRHNFKGNLGAHDHPGEGQVSRSIMEYLGKTHRHLNRISEYDAMAIDYGYFGKEPAHADWYCTDEHVPSSVNPELSAECSKDDATDDPYSHFVQQLDRALGHLVARGRPDVPNWTVKEMDRELTNAVRGLAAYYSSAEATAAQWTNWSAEGRPNESAEIQTYVLDHLKGRICDQGLEAEVAAKPDGEARNKAATNVTEVRSKAVEIAKPFKITEEQLTCAAAG